MKNGLMIYVALFIVNMIFSIFLYPFKPKMNFTRDNIHVVKRKISKKVTNLMKGGL